ncbi:2',3'-cyclic-nucleotide 2'-phosphodiesterase (5'-nucleotidase family)/predicted extracellular nuclease [Virgibacillus natechei]|uniref:2',3'-cyclic-nucleotide 2'-phosphodiesterase (5'-nucleotidase family)/predicted extracellular nuclease n=1 Tax=Virgibacillus natechei TaxID=1216297 RepID=A0ABS4IJ84_9BACI|nr:5'-nucleotidase C-terminal domain-containing protein [Virgibacillus natechei]MBP1970496.1 2',3'-cyclic-nucleotide 2'-phosphodiesterase (5'-nucleotidase family)/predicted extracellular nuclease [Virgibacillus natechei]UZD14099.1 5'-nucleotidase C-terminal domain-containing protein [Virgibacillus natechei]
MQARIRRKYFSMMMILVLMIGILTPAAGPVSVYADESDDEITVGEAIDKDNDGSEQTVAGYIVGYIISPENVSDHDFREDHNVALADEAGETDIDNMLFVQVSSDYRAAFGLNSNPDNLGEEIVVTGIMEEYHTHNGLKEPNDMRFASDNSEDPDEPLELQSIADVREQATGEVKTKGVVTAKLNNTIQIQDDTAAIAVRPTSLDVQSGDEITVTGSLNDYRGLLQLDNATVEEKTTDAGIPDPLSLNGNELESHQSKLAVIDNVTLTDVEDGGDWANYTAEDEAGNTFVVRDETGELSLETGITYDSITGMVIQFDADQQIIPRSQADIVGDASTVQSIAASPDPGTIPAGSDITLETATEDADIFYTTDGSDPSENGELYSDPITVDEDVIIKAIAEKDGITSSNIAEFSYSVYDAQEGVMIHDIQGEGHESPMNGNTVQDVEGIVTYKYDIRGSHYFHMQTPEADYDGNKKTSEGIVVYTGNVDTVDVGNLVHVTGEVDEYHIDGYDDRTETDLSVTQIAARDDWGGEVEVIEGDVELPSPIALTSSDIPESIIGADGFDNFEPDNYAIDYWESLEGMRVEVAPSRAVAPQEHGDLVVATEEFTPQATTANGGVRLTEAGPNAQTIQYKLHPNDNARDFAVKTGDQFTEPIEGVVNYGFGNYKVYADLEDVESAFEEGDTQPEQTTITKDEDQLTVATYNVENFSANESETSQQKAEDIARAFVSDMENPDIVGIVEVMDNNGQDQGPDDADASESYERLIDEIQNQGGVDYDYANIDPEYNQDGGAPHGNIRVGFLYNPERVSLTDGEHGTATDPTGYGEGQLMLNPGRIAPNEASFENTRKPLAAQFDFNGESVVVINNHFNSKSGDDGEFGQNQPPVKGSESQRHEMASIVNEFVSDIKADNPNENVVVLGDMNDFEFTETLDILKGDELTNAMMSVPEEERYTYLYQGNSQVLDHVLVSDHLADVTEIDVLHVNADFTDMHGRASDHDPILTQIDLEAAEEVEDNFELSIMHMNDTHARVEPLPKMVTAIKEFREDKPDSLLLHAGDVFSGTLYFNEFKGQADLELLNLMDLDAMVFGNHEFDLGDEEGGHESLSEFVKNANFPFLGTNIDFSQDPFMSGLETNQSLVDDPENGEIYDSIIKEIDGEQVGIFGLDTEDTANIASPAEVTFDDFIETAEQAVQDFEDEGIDKIIALTHIGFDSAPEVGNDLRLAEAVDGIDVIVGGHSHSVLEEPVHIPEVVTEDANGEATDPTIIVQAGEYAEYLGTLDVTFNANGVITAYEGELLEVDGFAEDPEATEALAPYKEQVDKVMNEEIGAKAMKDLTNPRQDEPGDDSVRANETELGNLVTDAMLAKAQEKFPDTVISFQNGGGIRAPIDEGAITTGEVINVLPFSNDPVIVTLTGQEIKDILEYSVRQAPAENGGFLHVSGMQFYYDSDEEPGNRVVQMYVENDGELEEIRLDGEYQVTTNGFTGQGGDGFETFEEAHNDGRVRDIGEIDWEQLRDYMVEDDYLGGIVDPEREDRIVDLMGEEFIGLPEDPNNENGGNGDDGDSGSDQNQTPPRKDDLNGDGTLPGGDGIGSDWDGTLPGGHGHGSGGSGTAPGGHGATLPDTATNMYMLLLIGSVLLATGGGILLYRMRYSQ